MKAYRIDVMSIPASADSFFLRSYASFSESAGPPLVFESEFSPPTAIGTTESALRCA